VVAIKGFIKEEPKDSDLEQLVLLTEEKVPVLLSCFRSKESCPV
jgi:hypothetical protein